MISWHYLKWAVFLWAIYPRESRAQILDSILNGTNSYHLQLNQNIKKIKCDLLIDGIKETDKEIIKDSFYPFLATYVVDLTNNKVKEYGYTINRIGFSLNRDQLVGQIYLVFDYSPGVLNYLISKYGSYNNAAGLGNRKTLITQNLTTYNWTLENFRMSLYINRNAVFSEYSKNDSEVVILSSNTTLKL